VPLSALVVSQIKLFAGTVGLLKEVVLRPVVVFVQVIPEVTTSVPAAEISVPYRIENVTEGVVPITVETMLVNVMLEFGRNRISFSELVGETIVIAFGPVGPEGPVPPIKLVGLPQAPPVFGP
jgi:hypothetical protein